MAYMHVDDIHRDIEYVARHTQQQATITAAIKVNHPNKVSSLTEFQAGVQED
jgi:cytochrome c biogenesis protein ResB